MLLHPRRIRLGASKLFRQAPAPKLNEGISHRAKINTTRAENQTDGLLVFIQRGAGRRYAANTLAGFQ